MPRDAVQEKNFDTAFDEAAKQFGIPPGGDDVGGDLDDGSREASGPPPSADPAVQPGDAVADPGSPAAEGDDPVGERLRLQIAAQEEAKKQGQQVAEQRRAQQAQKYGAFLDDIEANPALRAHIQSFWERGPATSPQGRQAPADQPEPKDPLAVFHDDDRTALTHALEQQEQKFSAMLEQALAPFRDQAARHAAESEIAALNTQFPDWEKFASREDLAAIRKDLPQLSALAAYKLVAFDRVRAQINTAGRQLATVRDVLNRPKPGESQPRRHVRVQPTKAPTFEEAYNRAYNAMNAAGLTPPRR